MEGNNTMEFTYAMYFSEEHDAEIMTTINGEENIKYKVIDGVIKVTESGLGSWDIATVTTEMIHADWQPWEEPRVPVGYWDAMVSILSDNQRFRVELSGHDSIYYGLNGVVVYDTDIKPRIAHICTYSMLNAKWYIVPTPEAGAMVGIDMASGPDESHVVSLSPGGHLSLDKDEPVFDLTYEEAKCISGNDLLNVECEVFVNGMRWKRSRGEWHDMHRNRIADVAPWLKLKKWRVVTD